MKTAKISDPKWIHIQERDDRIKKMAKLLRAMAKKGSEGIIGPEDLDKMEKAADAAEKSI